MNNKKLLIIRIKYYQRLRKKKIKRQMILKIKKRKYSDLFKYYLISHNIINCLLNCFVKMPIFAFISSKLNQFSNYEDKSSAI